jgi:hypothetical protein
MYQGRIDVLLNGDYQVRGSTRQCILAMLEGLRAPSSGVTVICYICCITPDWSEVTDENGTNRGELS